MSASAAATALDPALLARRASLALLLCARFAPLAWLSPWARPRGAPSALGAGVVLALVVCSWPAASAAAPALPTSVASLALLSLREVLLGGVYALALALPLLALEWAARASSRFAAVPGTEAALGTLQLAFAVACFFALGGHRVAIAVVVDGVLRLPPGAPSAFQGFSQAALGSARLVADAFASALLLALPVAAVLGLVEVSAALAARSANAPGFPAWLAPARPALALIVIWMSSVVLSGMLPQWFERGLAAARTSWPAP